MREVFKKIVEICELTPDNDITINDIKELANGALIRCQWAEEYGITLRYNERPDRTIYIPKSEFEAFSYYKDGYSEAKGKSIAWSDDGRQPVDEWLYILSFSTGAYIFGDDYTPQKSLFLEFFNELMSYTPDYKDSANSSLYWKIEKSSDIRSKFKEILLKYQAKNKSELKAREIAKLESKLAQLKTGE